MSRRVRALTGLVAGLALLRGCVAALDRPPAPPPALLDVDPARVTRLVLTRGSTSLALSRDAASPAGWSLRDGAGRTAAARPGADALLERLRAWRCDRPAGGGPERHAEWGVSDDAARGLRLEGAEGEVVADLLVGRIAGIELADAVTHGGALDTRRLGLFVRRRGEDATWVVSEFLTRELEPTAAAWALPPLHGVAPQDVARLVVRRGGATLTLALPPGQPPRLDGDPAPIDPDRARALVQCALGLAPKDLAGPPAAGEPLEEVGLEVTTHDGAVRACRLWRLATPGPPRTLAEVPGGVVELEPRRVERLLTVLREGLAPR